MINWDAIGAIGEVRGANAVVVTLVYLANQLKQNTRALHAASYEHWNTNAATYSDFIAKYGVELNEIDQIEAMGDIPPELFNVYVAHLNRVANQAETAFLLHSAGNMADEVFEARMNAYVFFFNKHPIESRGSHLADLFAQRHSTNTSRSV